MKLIDMKREKPKKGKVETAKMPEPYYEKYPYCLRLTLQKEELDKLGLKPTDFKVGGTIDLTAQAEVFTVREVQHLKENGVYDQDSKSVGLQIVKLALGKMTEKKASKMEEYSEAKSKGPGE